MSRKSIAVILVIVLAMIPMNFTSAQDPNAPAYLRFCDRIRDGDDNLEAGFDAASAQLQAIEDVLVELDSGRQAFSEVIAVSEQAITDWDAAVKLECLVPLNADVLRLLSEVLISSLYGQQLDYRANHRTSSGRR